MRGFILGTLATAVAFGAMAYLLKPNISYEGELIGLVVIALIAGVVNGLIKPIVRLLALPIRLATLGLIGFVINAGMLLLIAWLSDKVEGVNFTISGFPPDLSPQAFVWALVGSIVLSVVNTAIGLVVPD
ncbi:MAG TPA: phage holin family protein [Candidatus Limnocylindrales bacterium]